MPLKEYLSYVNLELKKQINKKKVRETYNKNNLSSQVNFINKHPFLNDNSKTIVKRQTEQEIRKKKRERKSIT